MGRKRDIGGGTFENIREYAAGFQQCDVVDCFVRERLAWDVMGGVT